MEDEQFFFISILVLLFAAGAALLVRLADSGSDDEVLAPAPAAVAKSPRGKKGRARAKA